MSQRVTKGQSGRLGTQGKDTHVTNNLLAIHPRLDIQITLNDLQHENQHAEYFTCDPLVT